MDTVPFFLTTLSVLGFEVIDLSGLQDRFLQTVEQTGFFDRTPFHRLTIIFCIDGPVAGMNTTAFADQGEISYRKTNRGRTLIVSPVITQTEWIGKNCSQIERLIALRLIAVLFHICQTHQLNQEPLEHLARELQQNERDDLEKVVAHFAEIHMTCKDLDSGRRELQIHLEGAHLLGGDEMRDKLLELPNEIENALQEKDYGCVDSANLQDEFFIISCLGTVPASRMLSAIKHLLVPFVSDSKSFVRLLSGKKVQDKLLNTLKPKNSKFE